MKDMKGYCHTCVYPLRYSDFDFKDELRFSSLLALVQESACKSADELGFGYDDLRPKNFGFITVSTYCELLKPVSLGDSLTIQTWPLPPRHVFCERDYRVMNQRKETVANLASRWCLVNLQNFTLLTPDAMGETHKACPYNPEKSVIVSSWKIPKSEEGRIIFKMMVGSSCCDHYFHANNCYYVDFFLDCFSMEELNRPIKSFQISYIKQAKEGAQLTFVRADHGSESICGAFEDTELIAQFRIIFSDK